MYGNMDTTGIYIFLCMKTWIQQEFIYFYVWKHGYNRNLYIFMYENMDTTGIYIFLTN